MAAEGERLVGLRERTKEGIFGELDDVYVNGHLKKAAAGNLNMSLRLRGRRVAFDGAQGIAVSHRFGLHLGQFGAFLCAARARCAG